MPAIIRTAVPIRVWRHELAGQHGELYRGRSRGRPRCDRENFDSDLAALDNGDGNYGGASVMLERSAGANADDVFGASGSLALTGSNVLFAGVTVGTFTQSGGQLVITFGDGATQAQVNGVLKAITYANSSHDFAAGTTTPIQIEWTFSDGNTGLQGLGGARTTAGITTVDLRNDFDGPGVTINQAAGQPDPALDGPILYNVVFGSSVTGFNSSDISFAGSTVGGTFGRRHRQRANYTVSVLGMTGNGNVVASIPAGAAHDAANDASPPPPAPTTR